MLSGAECGPGNNALNQFLKHTQNDRSLQQDRMGGGDGIAGSSSSAFRTARPGPGGSGGQQEFWQPPPGAAQHAAGPSGGAFDLGGMKDQMDAMRFNRPAPQQAGPGRADMEAAFRQPGGSGGAGGAQFAMPPPQMRAAEARASQGGSAWGDQFKQQQHFQQQRQGSPAAAPSRGAEQMSMPSYGGYGGGMGGMMGMSMGMGGMMGGYQQPMYSSQQQQSQPQQASSAQQSSRFVELDDKQWEEQFAKLDAEAQQEKNVQDKGKGKAKEDVPGFLDSRLSEEEQEARIKAALDELERDATIDGREASDRFEELWNSMNAHNATKDGIPPSAADAELAKWEEDLLKRNKMDMMGFSHPSGGLGGGAIGLHETAGLDGTEEALMNGYGSIGADGFPRLGDYRLQETNPFAQHANPLAEGLRLLSNGGSIADAALLFEAATQREVTGGTGGEQDEVDRARRERSEAWRRLGEAQAMNEREVQAIRALEEAIKIDENNLEAYMVSRVR